MDDWVEKIQDLETRSEIMHGQDLEKYEKLTIATLLKYVGDCFLGAEAFRWGTRWDPQNRILVIDPEAAKEDREAARSLEDLTMKEFSRLANDMTDFLHFTWDSPQRNLSGKMPVLDLASWMGEDTQMGVPQEILGEMKRPDLQGTPKKVVLNTFYRRPMARTIPMLRRSAVPVGTNQATIS